MTVDDEGRVDHSPSLTGLSQLLATRPEILVVRRVLDTTPEMRVVQTEKASHAIQLDFGAVQFGEVSEFEYMSST